jgi:dihydropteroate synthase
MLFRATPEVFTNRSMPVAKIIASTRPIISAQTARPTVIPAALANGNISFIRSYFWNHFL